MLMNYVLQQILLLLKMIHALPFSQQMDGLMQFTQNTTGAANVEIVLEPFDMTGFKLIQLFKDMKLLTMLELNIGLSKGNT